jgi:subtilisin family serine protease
VRAAGLGALVLLAAATAAAAQAPRALSPRLAAAAERPDSVLRVWILARPGTDLDRLAAEVRAGGGTVRVISRFVHGISATVPGRALVPLARRRDVRRVQPVGTYVRRPLPSPTGPVGRLPAVRLAPAADIYGPLSWAVRQLNVPAVHALGRRGAGVRIALLDGGFDTAHPLLAGARVIAQRDFVYGDSVVRDQPGEAQGEMAHGTAVWSVLASDSADVFTGVAPEADYLLAKTEYGPTETRTEEDNWVAGLEWAVGLGAQIVSSSLGYLTFDDGSGYARSQLTGDVAVTTIAADSAAAHGVLVIVAVGNEGPGAQSLGTPADGDSVIAVGATDSTGAVAAFSSRGPTADGRIKPDVVAPGVRVPGAASGGLVLLSGSSMATPLVAGVAALAQEPRGAAPALPLADGLRRAGDHRAQPDNTRGYGIPDALQLYTFPTGVQALAPLAGPMASITPTFTWHAETPADAGALTYRVRVATDSLLQTVLLDTTLTATTLTLAAPLAPGARIWWRVSAASLAGAADSTAAVGPAVAPSWVTLLTLASAAGASIRDETPLFSWAPAQVTVPPGPFRYDVAVYPSSRPPAAAVAGATDLADTVFTPSAPLERNLPFRWHVIAHLGTDSQVVTSPGTFVIIDESVPATTLLYQNFPNPFPNAATGLESTCIWFDLAQEGEVRLEVFDLRGRLVRRLAPSSSVPERLPPGRYGRPAADAPGTCDRRFSWDGRDDTGGFVRAGAYVYRLTAPGFSDTRHVIFRGQP